MPPLRNPLKVARETAGLSQQKLADHLDYSKTAVLRAEQGLYVMPPVGFLKFSSETLGVPDNKIYTDYREFQAQHRLVTTKLWRPLPMHYHPLDHPLAAWRDLNGCSKIGFSVAWCIHPAVVNEFEAYRTVNLPAQLVTALTSVNRKDDLITIKLRYGRVKP